MIDAYAHIGLPRFQSEAHYRAIMELVGIDKAVVCPFDACPDLAAVHATLADPRSRGLGLPLGADRAEMERGVLAQLDAGFAGLRLSSADVRDRPWLLSLLASRGAFPLVCGDRALADGAASLCNYLDCTPDGLTVGGHFAGPTDPRILETDPAVKALFGTEAPMLCWRDEKVAETPHWIERFVPTEAQRAAFFTDNAERLVFDRSVPTASPLHMAFDPWRDAPDRDTPMWPFGLSIDAALTDRLVSGWMEWGGEARGTLRAYLQDVLDGALPRLPS